jgi:predicted Co/Zn/Cd cation transporter (cation efflux family)
MRQGLAAIDGALALIVLVLIVQIWLLSATLETFLAGHRETALPSAIASGVLFFACLGLYLFVERIDRESRKE